MRKEEGGELEEETIEQKGTGLAQGKPYGIVEIGRDGKGSWKEVQKGREAGE